MSIEPFVLSLSKHERLFANVRRFHSPFDRLRANVPRADSTIVNRLLGPIGEVPCHCLLLSVLRLCVALESAILTNAE